EIGFADHSHMTRAYKKKFGITPKQERNSKKEKTVALQPTTVAINRPHSG
ncbi:MAG: AraC family transcriptional regulator, partial [Halieaceae bacterium]|nr:AraC family transcriptional regulator [Halieaceae bacterium]